MRTQLSLEQFDGIDILVTLSEAERKKIMLDESVAVIALPGAIGTIAEFEDAIRLVNRLGSSAPAVIGFAAIAELYEEKKAAQLISIANSVITGSMAAAPSPLAI